MCSVVIPAGGIYHIMHVVIIFLIQEWIAVLGQLMTLVGKNGD